MTLVPTFSISTSNLGFGDFRLWCFNFDLPKIRKYRGIAVTSSMQVTHLLDTNTKELITLSWTQEGNCDCHLQLLLE